MSYTVNHPVVNPHGNRHRSPADAGNNIGTLAVCPFVCPAKCLAAAFLPSDF